MRDGFKTVLRKADMTKGEWTYIAAVVIFGLVGATYGTAVAVTVGIIGIGGFIHHSSKKDAENLLRMLKKEAECGYPVKVHLPTHGNATARFQLRIDDDGSGVPVLKSVTTDSKGIDLLSILSASDLQIVQTMCQQEANEGARLIRKLERQTN